MVMQYFNVFRVSLSRKNTDGLNVCLCDLSILATSQKRITYMKAKKILSCSFFLLTLCLVSIAQKDSLSIENLVFEGAGIRGIAYCGALMELDERHLLDQVTNAAGTSSGAITACFYSIGYSPTEIYDLIGETDFGAFNDGRLGAIGGLYRLNKKLGWYRGKKFLTWLEEKIEAQTGNRNLTFAELQKLTFTNEHFKELVVAATSLNHQQSIYFSAETFPQMRIADAVHASMAVPLYFEPVVIDSTGKVVDYDDLTAHHHLCVDGGFTANFIISYFDKKEPAATIGLRIDSNEQITEDQGERELAYQHIQSTSDFMKAFYYITKENLNRSQLTEADWQRTVSISDSNIGPKVKKLSAAEKKILIDAGRKGVQEYLR